MSTINNKQKVVTHIVTSPTVLTANLVLRDDDLSTIGIFGTGNGVLEDTDSTDDLAFLSDANLAFRLLASAEVAGVTDDLLGLYGLITTPHANELAISIGDDLVDSLVEHVCSSVDSTQTSERLRELSKAVQGVDVRRLAVTRHRGGV